MIREIYEQLLFTFIEKVIMFHQHFFCPHLHNSCLTMPLAPTEVHAKRVRSLFSLIRKQKENGGKHANSASFIFCRFAFSVSEQNLGDS